MSGILQVRSEAYSSWSEKNVNDCNETAVRVDSFVREKNVDSKADGREALRGVDFSDAGLWKS
jgi:hypothetical protein